MDYSRKNSDELSEEDNKSLFIIVARLAVGLHMIYAGQKSPRENALDWIKKLKIKKAKAGIFILFGADLNPQMLLTPSDFNKLLTDGLSDSFKANGGDLLADSYAFSTRPYLPSNRLSELLTSMEIEVTSHIF